MKKNLFNVFLVCVFCMAAIPDMFAQQIKVTGKVTDSTNEGMPGVNVQVKGTTTGTITDFDGNYSIDVPDSKSTLVFSFIGYVTQQLPVGGKKVLNVQLKDDTQTLDEVVVVAYGTARKSDLTGATASLRPDANDASKTASFNNLLQGKVAGLNVTSSMAAPGAASSVTIVALTHCVEITSLCMLLIMSRNLPPGNLQSRLWVAVISKLRKIL